MSSSGPSKTAIFTSLAVSTSLLLAGYLGWKNFYCKSEKPAHEGEKPQNDEDEKKNNTIIPSEEKTTNDTTTLKKKKLVKKAKRVSSNDDDPSNTNVKTARSASNDVDDLESMMEPKKFTGNTRHNDVEPDAYDIVHALLESDYGEDDDGEDDGLSDNDDNNDPEDSSAQDKVNSDQHMTTCSPDALSWGGCGSGENDQCNSSQEKKTAQDMVNSDIHMTTCSPDALTWGTGGDDSATTSSTPSKEGQGQGCCGGSSGSNANSGQCCMSENKDTEKSSGGCCNENTAAETATPTKDSATAQVEVLTAEKSTKSAADDKTLSSRRALNTDFMRPGRGAVWVKTFGCSHNVSDSEVMMGLLKRDGYELVDSFEKAHVCIINSCTVKNPSQDAAVNLVRKECKSKPVILTGCVSQADPELVKNLQDKNISVLGLSYTARIVEVVENILAGNKVYMMDFMKNPMKESPELPDLLLPKVRRNPFVEIITINTGCLGACTYCKTKQARGTLKSYPLETIVARAKVAFEEGVQQIWLTSEDTGAYGIDIGTDIVKLLKALVELVPEHGILRLGMTNPPYMARHSKDIAEILAHPKVFEFLHVPLQSGSDEVLKNMYREYTSAVFTRMCDALLKRNPNMTLATDIICGFPGERDENHYDTIKLMEKYKFSIVNISQFYPRPGTDAAKMKRTPTHVAKKRSTEVTKVFESYKKNDFLAGKICPVWFSGTEMKQQQTCGHTKQHVKVVIPRDDKLLGKRRICRILDCANKWHVTAELLSDEEVAAWEAEQKAAEEEAAKSAENTEEENIETTTGSTPDHASSEEVLTPTGAQFAAAQQKNYKNFIRALSEDNTGSAE